MPIGSDASLAESIEQPLAVFLIATLFYATFYVVNDTLIERLDAVPGAYLFRLSSGIKLLLVLLIGWVGSAAIATFCFVWCVLILFPENWQLAAEIALSAGLMPLLACQVIQHRLLPDLSRLRWPQLFVAAAVFATLNSLTRESILYLHLQQGDLVQNVMRTFFSDLLGIFTALYACRFLLMRLGPSVKDE
jgi:hypothetical protein